LADANRSSDAPPPAGPSAPDTSRGGARGERAIAALGAGVRGLGRWAARFVRDSARAWRYLDGEQRVAAVGSVLLIVSTFGDAFSFVEGAVVLVALAVLLLLKKRADGRSFHLPFGDGAVIMAAGAWSALLIVVRLLDRPLGQNLLALVCATLLALAGLRMRLRRPADDLPRDRARRGRGKDWTAEDGGVEIDFAPPGPAPARADEDATAALPRDRRDEPTAALPRDEELTAPLPKPPPSEQAGPFRARPAPPPSAPPPRRRRRRDGP
jgi:hypothetical protein